MGQAKLWTKNFILNAGCNLIIYTVYYFLIVIMASYAMDKLHASPSQAGLATGLFIVGALAARLLAGILVEALGEMKTLYVGLVVYLALTFAYFAVTDVAWLFLVRLIHGFGFGVSATATGSIAARIIPLEQRGEGISYYALSMTLASAIGPFLGMYLSQNDNFNVILILSVILLIVCAAAAMLIRLPARGTAIPFALPAENVKKTIFSLRKFLEPKALPVSVICGIVVIGFSGILAFLSPYAKENNMIMAGNLFFLVYSAFVLISRPFTGKLFDKKGENFVIYPSIVLFAAGLLLLGLTHSTLPMLAAAAAVGLGYGTFFSSANALALKVSPVNQAHIATSTYFILADLGMGVGPYFLGFIIPLTGFRGLYLAMAALVLACVVLYHFVHGAKTTKQAAVLAEKF